MLQNRPPKIPLPDSDEPEPYSSMVSHLIEEDLRAITAEVARTLAVKRIRTD